MTCPTPRARTLTFTGMAAKIPETSGFAPNRRWWFLFDRHLRSVWTIGLHNCGVTVPTESAAQDEQLLIRS